MTRCRELREDLHSDRPRPCGAPAVEVRLRCPAGRPDAVAAYCDEHGGEERARAEARRDWMYAAPESVGGRADVEDAGCLQLQTIHAYVVVRQVPADQGGKWLAWLGLGGALTPVANPAPEVRVRPDGTRRGKRGGKRVGASDGRLRATGTNSFPSRESALEVATAKWRRGVEEHVEAIRRARGGTLAWGTPVEPLDSPIVILIEQGDSRSAWDVAVTLQPRSRAGVSAITGLRPSGECA